jgi:hypothetical protein
MLYLRNFWIIEVLGPSTNVRDNRTGNQELTIQIYWQHWVRKTQDEDKQNKKHNTANLTRHFLLKCVYQDIQESERSCVCVLGVIILLLSAIFL